MFFLLYGLINFLLCGGHSSSSAQCVCVFIKRRNECLPIRENETEPTHTETWREREREEEERRATVEDGRGRRGTGGPVSSNVPIEMPLRQSGILGRADRKTNPLSLWLRLSPLPFSFISGSPSITPLSQVYTYSGPRSRSRPAFAPRSPPSFGFFSWASSDREDGRRPIFHLFADLKSTLLIPTVSHTTSDSQRWIGGHFAKWATFATFARRRIAF